MRVTLPTGHGAVVRLAVGSCVTVTTVAMSARRQTRPQAFEVRVDRHHPERLSIMPDDDIPLLRPSAASELGLASTGCGRSAVCDWLVTVRALVHRRCRPDDIFALQRWLPRRRAA